jgi:hypothetical protein
LINFIKAMQRKSMGWNGWESSRLDDIVPDYGFEDEQDPQKPFERASYSWS